MKKACITKWKHRRDVFDMARMLLFMFLIYAIINGIGITRLDIEGIHTFLIWFNGVMMYGILLFLFFLDFRKYNILNYGKLFVSHAKGEKK